MGDTIMWTPYREKMLEQLNQLPLQAIRQWQGKEISLLEKDGCSTIKAFSMEKAAKICIGSFRVNDELQYGLCTIFPKIEYRLPVFLSRWEERAQEIDFLVDFMPTVDFLIDQDFRARYLEIMGQYWEKYASLEGICPEENDTLRSACSIIHTAARMPIEREGMRLAALAPHTEYLKHYIEFIKDAVPVENQAKHQEVKRKTASLTNILRGYFSHALNSTLDKTVGAGNSETVLSLFL